MSDDSAKITATLVSYDALVRNGLRQGDIVEKIVSRRHSIKQFYSACQHQTFPESVAAFNAPFFMHGFLSDFRKSKDSPTFLEDQRRRLAEYDAWIASIHPPVSDGGMAGVPLPANSRGAGITPHSVAVSSPPIVAPLPCPAVEDANKDAARRANGLENLAELEASLAPQATAPKVVVVRRKTESREKKAVDIMVNSQLSAISERADHLTELVIRLYRALGLSNDLLAYIEPAVSVQDDPPVPSTEVVVMALPTSPLPATPSLPELRLTQPTPENSSHNRTPIPMATLAVPVFTRPLTTSGMMSCRPSPSRGKRKESDEPSVDQTRLKKYRV